MGKPLVSGRGLSDDCTMDQSTHILLIAGSAEAHGIAAQIAQTSQRMQAFLRAPERSFGPLPVPWKIWCPASVEAMKLFLKQQRITAICDAGHGFDADVSDRAAAAAAELGLAYGRVLRPVWPVDPPGLRAASVAEAGALILPGARVFAATGRGTVAQFAPFAGARLFLRQNGPNARSVLPDFVEPVLGTPPFTVAQEVALFEQLNIDTMICRNVGGAPSRPKLDAARQMGLRTIVIDRPAPPRDVRIMGSTAEAVDWLAAL
ncbi:MULTISPECIES: precorrin-6A/cobalt-precorrin-6A reductase [unclassified Sulfitobacter]|uniref:precorrin-6A/cobalt-precorrin-6A reductase n=1 Tax=unclassified Sulfitobacter TaxID=196795 RepID=UPI0020CC0259|nr:precorrin-6A/cobalt-precorrin-6A reductase [Sulfitobacter sp. HGT1]